MARKSTPRSRVAYKWIALSVTTLGSFMAAVDSTIVILGLPEMMKELHADLVEMVWVMMGYLLVSTIFLLTFGRIADMLGRVRMYNLGFVIFTLGSVLCGFSNTAPHLILFRLVQGMGAAMILVNSIAILTEAFPKEERGFGLGINSITWAAGGVLGPVLGGVILNLASWRWVFYVNLPVGLFGAVWGYAVLREISPRGVRERFDWLGALTFSLGLIALLLFLSLGVQYRWGSRPLVGLLAASVVLFVLFFWREHRAAQPVLDLSLFKVRAYNFAVLAAMMQSLAIFAVNFLIVFYLIGVRNFNPLSAAFLLIPLPALIAVTAPFSGRLADRIGARLPATLGLLFQCGALGLLTTLSCGTSYIALGSMLGLMGLGGGLFYSPNTSSAMSAAPPPRLGVASGTLSTLRQTGMVTSFALSLAVAAASLPHDIMLHLFVGTGSSLSPEVARDFILSLHNAFLVSMMLCFVAAIFSVVRGPTRPARA